MLLSLAGLSLVVLTTWGTSLEADANAPALHYSVEFDEGTGSASLRCTGSSSGACTFWIGDTALEHRAADASGTLAVDGLPVIVRVNTTHPGYCAGLSTQAPPKWPDCTHGPLGGALDRSATVDYRWR